MSGSSHIQSVLIGVEYRNCRRTYDVYLLFAILLGQIKSKIISYRYVNKFWLNLPHPNSKKLINIQSLRIILIFNTNQNTLNMRLMGHKSI